MPHYKVLAGFETPPPAHLRSKTKQAVINTLAVALCWLVCGAGIAGWLA